MRLSKKTLKTLAEMICESAGGARFEWPHFPYRSSSYLTDFFTDCDMDYVHDGSTRKWWVQNTLDEINGTGVSNPQLPPDGIIRVIQELMDPAKFDRIKGQQLEALKDLNNVLSRDGLEAYLDGANRCYLRSTGTNITSAIIQFQRRAWTKEELSNRKKHKKYLESISEDELIEDYLVPLFRQLGFIRISSTGHKDKLLEYGNDLWMKYQIPTNHYIYFGTQVKIKKLDASGKSKNVNISEVLTQIQMMLKSPIWDPETNKKHLLDHVFIVSAKEITKQAKQWLGQHLDQESRSHILFLDQNDILDLAIGCNLKIVGIDDEVTSSDDSDDLPF